MGLFSLHVNEQSKKNRTMKNSKSVFAFRNNWLNYFIRLVTRTLQKWNLYKSGCDDGVKIELRLVLAQFGANLSLSALRMLLSGL